MRITHYFDFCATYSTTIFNTYRPRYDRINPNASYRVGAYNESIKKQNNRILKALNLPNGIICITQSASHSAKIVSDLFNGQILCKDSAHDSIYELQKPYDSRFQKFCRVYTPINNVTGSLELYEGETKHKDEYIAYDITSAIGRWYMNDAFWNGVDIAWMSGHKIGTEVGIGMLWLSDRVCDSFGFGVNPKNNWGVFHGTVNYYQYLTLACAVEYANEYQRYCCFTADLCTILNEKKIKYELIGMPMVGSIGCFRFVGINGEMLADMLADDEIYISKAQSACAYSNKGNRVLEYFGCKNYDECVRISSDQFQTDDLANHNNAQFLADAIEEKIKIIKGE